MSPPAKSKKIAAYIKLQIPAGEAKPSPPVGPALGQRGLNIMEFCKAFNAQTQSMEKGMPCPVLITAYADKTFSFIIKTPPVSYFLKKAANITSGSKAPGRSEKVGTVTMNQVQDIAKIKIQDMQSYNMESACREVMGSAKSMGVEIIP